MKANKPRKAGGRSATSRKRIRSGNEASIRVLRDHISRLLDGGSAHIGWKEALDDFPPELQGAKAAGSPHTPWQLLEHARIALGDILEFSRNPSHVSPQFPDGYWPPTETPPNSAAWEKSAKALERDLQGMKKLVSNPKTDLFGRIAHGQGQTILREALVAADHNAYHLGQIVLLRKMLGAWPES